MANNEGKMSGLTQEDLDYLQANMKNYKEDTIKELYEGFKINIPDGHMTNDNFLVMIRESKEPLPNNVKEFYDRYFQTFDTDKNGFIEFKEFVLAGDLLNNGTPAEQLKWYFKMYDLDGNGVIDQDEMTKMLHGIYYSHGETLSIDSAEDKAKEIFNRLDENGDGHLTEEEFVQGCLQDKDLFELLADQ